MFFLAAYRAGYNRGYENSEEEDEEVYEEGYDRGLREGRDDSESDCTARLQAAADQAMIDLNTAVTDARADTVTEIRDEINTCLNRAWPPTVGNCAFDDLCVVHVLLGMFSVCYPRRLVTS